MSLHFLSNVSEDKYRRKFEKQCDLKIKKIKEEYDLKLKDEFDKSSEINAPKSISYPEYKKKHLGNKDSPLSFGGSKSRRFRNVEYRRHGNGHHTIRRVNIVGNRGHKSVTTQMGKTRRIAKKALTVKEIKKICNREFIPGLFDDCVKREMN
jgi:hypothetical protein